MQIAYCLYGSVFVYLWVYLLFVGGERRVGLMLVYAVGVMNVTENVGTFLANQCLFDLSTYLAKYWIMLDLIKESKDNSGIFSLKQQRL